MSCTRPQEYDGQTGLVFSILQSTKCYNISIPGDEAQLVASPSEWKPCGPSRRASYFKTPSRDTLKVG